jgi:hypothetical protein
MTLESAEQAVEQPTAVITEVDPDAGLRSAYERAMASDEPDDEAPQSEETKAQRDERGRFTKAEQASEDASSPSEEAEGQQDVEQPESSDRAVPPVGLPANWRPDMADIWTKLPEPERDRLGKWSQELHAKMSDMGRQVSQLRDFQPVVEYMQQAFPQKFGPGGVPPAQGLAALAEAAYALDHQPVQALMQLATESGVLPQLAQALGVQGGGNVADLHQTIHQLRQELGQYASPDAIQYQIDQAMTVREVTSSVERFKSEKPFYADVEAELPSYIEIAWKKWPDANAVEVLDKAYDMAVNADPAVREKAHAAARQAAASKVDPKRAAGAKKAASINVTSTSTGKGTPMSEEDMLRQAYRRVTAA